MIVILYPGGGFGSTIQYSIRHFSNKFKYVEAKISDDGSMHSFIQECHPRCVNELLSVETDKIEIANIRYPDESGQATYSTIKEFQNIVGGETKVIFVVLDTAKTIERNWLFLYHKTGNFLTKVLSKHANKWDKNANDFNSLKPWQQRELFSIVIKDSIPAFQQARRLALNNWLILTPDDILFNFEQSISKILDYLDAPLVDRGVAEYYCDWFEKQKYILDEYSQFELIINSVLSNSDFSWEPIPLIMESMIQYKLSELGYNLKCYELNKFPTSTEELKMHLDQLNI